MTEEATFITAILSEPDDDTPRLVYADWLQEHGGPLGDARAEFIREQVKAWRSGDREVMRLSDQPDDVDYGKPARRLLSHAMVWLLPHWSGDGVPRLSPLLIRELGWTRGFVSHVTCRASDWLRHADALFWSPRQTEECDLCGGVHLTATPRPLAVAAHPVRSVTFTEMDALSSGRSDFVPLDLAWFAVRWRGIDFENRSVPRGTLVTL